MEAAETVAWLLASMVLPTLVLRTMSRPPRRSAGRRLAAWGCLWASQLTVPLLLVGWISLLFGHDVYRLGWLVTAMVYGGGGAATAGVLVTAGVALGRAGLAIVRTHDDSSAARACVRAGQRLLAGLLGVSTLFLLMSVLPIPGRFGPLVYLFLVLAPLGAAGSAMLLVAGLSLRSLRPRR